MTCVTAHSHSRVFKSRINRDPPFSYGGDSKTFRCLEALPESNSKASKNIKNFNLQISRTFKVKSFKSFF